MILSAVVLNSQFVGVVSGPYWNQPIFQDSQLPQFNLLNWFRNPDRVPPDPDQSVSSKTSSQLSVDPSFIALKVIENKINDVFFCSHFKVCYEACQKRVSDTKRGALIDRGANGGLAGSDVRAIHIAGREVDVQGIDNHQLTNIPIVTAAGVVETQKGSLP